MSTETIRDFLVSLGWQVKEDEYRRFVDSLERATLRAKLLGDAIEAMARRVWEAVSDTAEAFDRMFFAASRNNVAAETMRALGYAAQQAGLSVGEANTALDTMARKIRENGPGGMVQANRVGFGLNPITKQLEYNLELGRKFAALPNFMQEAFGHDEGLSEGFIEMLRHPEQMAKNMADAQKAMASSGLGGDAWKSSYEFMQQFRRLWMDLGTHADAGLTRLMNSLTPILQKFADFVEKNGDNITKWINGVVDAIAKLVSDIEDKLEKVDWNKVNQQFASFAASAKAMTDSVGGLTAAFEVFFGIWIGSKFVGALAAMSRMLAVLGPIGDIAVMLGLGYGAAKLGENGPTNAGPTAGQGTAGGAGSFSTNQDAIDSARGHGVDPSRDNGSGFGRAWRNSTVGSWWGRTMPTWLGGDSAGNAAHPSSSADEPGAGQDGVMTRPTGANLPRNIRNNNPGNVIDGAWAQRQPGYAGSDGHFAIFDSPENGYRAANRNLDSYARQGLVTPRQILNRWAPGNSGEGNDPEAYAASVRNMTGLNPDDVVSNDPAVRARLLMGITQVEGGQRSPYTAAQITAALGGRAPADPWAWTPAWQGMGVNQSPWRNSSEYWQNSAPLGASSGDTTNHYNPQQTVTVNVTGSGDPAAVGGHVASNINRRFGDITANMIGAVN